MYNPFGIFQPIPSNSEIFTQVIGVFKNQPGPHLGGETPLVVSPPLPAFAACCLASVNEVGIFFQLTPGRVDVLLLMG